MGEQTSALLFTQNLLVEEIIDNGTTSIRIPPPDINDGANFLYQRVHTMRQQLDSVECS